MSVAETYPGLRVVELTTTVAGPYTGMILADLGADVVKVERPGRGDDARAMPPHVDGQSVLFGSVNRNKRSVVLDLATPAGLAACRRLFASADVVVQNLRPGAVEALGLDAQTVLAAHPRLVYCSISAYGTGPEAAGRPGYDPLVQAFVGMMSITGPADGTEPSRVPASLIDLGTGMWSAIAVMAALARRERTGRGEHVTTALVDSGFALLCHQAASTLATGQVPAPMGSGTARAAPFEAFRTADGWVMIAAANEVQFGRFCTAVGRPELAADERFATAVARVDHRAELHALLEEALGAAGTADWLARLSAAGVPSAPVHDMAEALAHPLTAERALFGTPDGGTPQVRLPLDDTRPTAFRPAPRLGEHTAEVLAEAGLTPAEIAEIG